MTINGNKIIGKRIKNKKNKIVLANRNTRIKKLVNNGSLLKFKSDKSL